MNWIEKINRDRAGNITSQSWRLDTKAFYASIVEGHIHYPGRYLLQTDLPGLNKVDIGETSGQIEAATKNAEQLIRQKVADIVSSIETANQ